MFILAKAAVAFAENPGNVALAKWRFLVRDSRRAGCFVDEYDRFEYGEPPEKNGDYAFLLHIIKSLKSTGKGAVILPHGVLFRGNVEADIRRNIIRQGYIGNIGWWYKQYYTI
jgi:hypothetical protein